MNSGVVLHGSEDVRRAGNQIDSAAESMRRTQGFQAEELQRHRIFMDEWLERFEKIMEGRESE